MRKEIFYEAFFTHWIVVSLILGLTSCVRVNNDAQIDTLRGDYNIVAEFGSLHSGTSMVYRFVDLSGPEAITEISSHIVMCKILSVEDVVFTDTAEFNFRYSIQVEDILFDATSTLEIGDVISITSSEGIMKASEAAEMIGHTARSQKLGILQGEYGENDYILCSSYNAIPIEVGHTYILYLTDRYLEAEGVYAESGRSLLYEYTEDGEVFTTRNMTPCTENIDQVLDRVNGLIQKRSGRVEQVGFDRYTNELAARQRRERRMARDEVERQIAQMREQ